jgi:solute carrier family 25 (mitochondrial carrier), member 14/30
MGEVLEKFGFAGISCMFAGACTNPIDVIKTRLQLQRQDIKYRGFFRGMFLIAKEEGFRGLMKGAKPSILREGTYSTIRIGGYEPVKNIIQKDPNVPLSLVQKITAGAIAGMIGASLTTPTDVVKVRMQSSMGGSQRYRGVTHAFIDIYQNEGGLRGLWRGTGPNVLRGVVICACQMPSYDHSKHWLIDNGLMSEEAVSTHFAASMIAGLVTATASSPVDVVKTRVMNAASSGGGFASASAALVATLKVEGPAALFKGWTPNYLRIGPHTIISFMVFERLRAWAGMKGI